MSLSNSSDEHASHTPEESTVTESPSVALDAHAAPNISSDIPEEVEEQSSSSSSSNTTAKEDAESDPPMSEEQIAQMLQDIQSGGNAAGTETGSTPSEESPEPKLTPEQCFEKHVSTRLQQDYRQLAEEDQNRLDTTFSLSSKAVEVEKAHKERRDVEDSIDWLIKYSRVRVDPKTRSSVKKELQKARKELMDRTATYAELRDELHKCIRSFITEVEEREIEKRRQEALKYKPFSKGVIRHFWDAVMKDDPQKLLKTLCTEDMVRTADYAVYRGNRCAGVTQTRPLLELLMDDSHHMVPAGGAVECVRAIRGKYPGLVAPVE